MLYPSVNRQKSWLLFLLIAVVCLNLYFNFTFVGSLQERSRWIDSTFGKLLIPLQRTFSFFETTAVSSVGSISELLKAEDENKKLRTQLEQNDLRLQNFEEVKQENDRLRGLLEFKQSQPLALMAAKIIGRDSSLFFRTIEINRGFEDGVVAAMAVVCSHGIVGRVLRAAATSSTVLLTTDANSKIDAVVQRSRTRTIVGGSTSGDLTLRFLPRRFDIRQGDELVSSGLDNFPEGFRLGTVVGLAQDPNYVLEQAVLEPTVDFDSLEEVFVVKGNKS